MKNSPAIPNKVPSKSLLTLAQQVEQLEASKQLAQHYCHSGMVPSQYKGKPDDGAVAIQWGAEIGLAPLQSLQNIAVINGSPALWGDALVALVKASGQCKYLSSDYDETTQTATVKTQRVGEPEESRRYSMKDAERAGLAGRPTYKQHPARMLNARARSHLLRDVYADLLRGIQIREIVEEDNEVYNLDGTQEKDITPTTDSATLNELLVDDVPPDFAERLSGAETMAVLSMVAKEIAKTGLGNKNLLNLYYQRKQELKACQA